MKEAIHDIGIALGQLDPEGAAIYEANAEAAEKRLDDLIEEAKSILDPIADRPFIVSHDGYNLFASTFGLTVAGSILDMDANAASVRTLSNLGATVEEGNALCVFGEVGHDAKLVNRLVEKGARLGDDLDPGGVTITPGPNLYDELILGLAKSLADCLGQ